MGFMSYPYQLPFLPWETCWSNTSITHSHLTANNGCRWDFLFNMVFIWKPLGIIKDHKYVKFVGKPCHSVGLLNFSETFWSMHRYCPISTCEPQWWGWEGNIDLWKMEYVTWDFLSQVIVFEALKQWGLDTKNSSMNHNSAYFMTNCLLLYAASFYPAAPLIIDHAARVNWQLTASTLYITWKCSIPANITKHETAAFQWIGSLYFKINKFGQSCKFEKSAPSCWCMEKKMHVPRNQRILIEALFLAGMSLSSIHIETDNAW